tara:strand:- start:126 stop:524 length:399 start_codon:yes stop_codon:yes gene_type:complete
MNYCSNCGSALNSGDRFCPSCGTKVGSTVLNSSATAKFSHEFTSKILLGGNILAPDKVIITESGVTYIKRNKYLIGKDRVHLVYQNISSVRIDRKLIDADIIISGRGAVEITAKDFSISDAKKIEQLINQLL